jgi:hypothetical protein
MIRYALTLAPLLLLSSTAFSQQQSKTASYYCDAEWAAGAWFSSATKRWEGSGFNPDSFNFKFILKVKFLTTRNGIQLLGRPEQYGLEQHDYNVTITPSGSRWSFDCLAGKASALVTSHFGRIECGAVRYDYVFSFDSNEFLQVYTGGYLTGKDSKDDTPSISGGTCTEQR